MSFTPTSLLKQIDYTSVDVSSIKQSMLARIPQICPEWTDQSESDFGIVLVELFSGACDMLKQYQDRTMNEGFIDTVETRDAMQAQCALIGYVLSSPKAAILYLAFSVQLDPRISPSVRIPQGTQLSIQAADGTFIFLETSADVTASLPVNTTVASLIDNLNFVVNDTTNINAGDILYLGGQNDTNVVVQSVNSGTQTVTLTTPATYPIVTGDQLASVFNVYQSPQVLAYEGQTRYQEILGYSNGYPGLAFTLSFPNVLDSNAGGNTASSTDPNQILLFIDEGAGQTVWSEIADFSLASSTDNVYTQRADNYGYTTIFLGDGKNGRVPVAGAQISATYRTGGGSRGNSIGAGSSLLLTSAISGVVGATALTKGNGGADIESIDHARSAGPANLQALNRAVTASDYVTLAKRADPSIISAQPSVEDWNTVNLAILTNGMSATAPALPLTTQTLVANYLAPRMMLTQTLTLSAVTITPIYLSGNLYVKLGSAQALVLANVINALTQYFSLGQLDIGKNIYLSTIEALVQNIPGVDYFDITNLSLSSSGSVVGDITIANGAVAVLPNTNLNIAAYGGF